MASDAQKYRAQFFQISGFAFFTPLGRLVLGLLEKRALDFSLGFFLALAICFLFAAIGIILISEGLEHLE